MKNISIYYCICMIGISLLLLSCGEKSSTYTIGVSQCSNDSWRRKMNTEMLHEAALHQNIELLIKTVEDDTEKQISDIQYFIDQKVDLLIVSPNKAAPINHIVGKAFDAGIPVILVDRKILSDKYTAFIGADNYQIGKEVGNYVVNLLKGKGRIIELRGLEGSSPALERHQGFFSVISEHPEIHLMLQEDAAWLKDVAESKMERALNEYEQIDLVFAHNDRMAMGAYDAANRIDRADNIYFLGIDALPGNEGGIENVLQNKLEATFIYPTGGDKIIQLALDILQGKEYKHSNELYTAVVDKTNARVLKLQSDEIIEQENKINFLNNRVDTFVSQYTMQQYMLYSAVVIVVLLIGFFFFMFRAYRSKHRLNIELANKNEAINEQKDMLEQQRDQLILLSKKLEEATHAKLVFFTNISHEFRTPLTLIAGPVSSLLTSKDMNIEQKRLLSLVQKNISILLKLVDQIVDFRKYENGKLNLCLTTGDLKQQFMEWNESFAEVSHKKRIHFNFEILSDVSFMTVFDQEKMERIYFNLLSNAIKFTPERGMISVSLDAQVQDDEKFAIIKVSNSGAGIPEQDIRNIFDRFYQVDSRMAGSGIGLALVKALVELHGGQIWVESRLNSDTTFVVMIPFRKAVDIPDDQHPAIINEQIYPEQKWSDLIEEKEGITFMDVADRNRSTILVIDDNVDIRSYIKTILQDQYTIIEAKDGAEGIRKAVKYVPDVIISDIMMPEVDGIELCRQVKQQLSTSHIPVILLTACSLDEQRITGFESGADDYISKPFNFSILEVRIRKLIENRKRLKEIFGESLFLTGTKLPGDDLDKGFIEKLKSIIEENISDSELNVEDLGKNIGLSRVQLYRKVKSLTNYSPNELLKIIRLKKAYGLLSTSEMTISEVAYEVGFTSPSYFTKCFREFYSESPTDYLKRVR